MYTHATSFLKKYTLVLKVEAYVETCDVQAYVLLIFIENMSSFLVMKIWYPYQKCV